MSTTRDSLPSPVQLNQQTVVPDLRYEAVGHLALGDVTHTVSVCIEYNHRGRCAIGSFFWPLEPPNMRPVCLADWYDDLRRVVVRQGSFDMGFMLPEGWVIDKSVVSIAMAYPGDNRYVSFIVPIASMTDASIKFTTSVVASPLPRDVQREQEAKDWRSTPGTSEFVEWFLGNRDNRTLLAQNLEASGLHITAKAPTPNPPT